MYALYDVREPGVYRYVGKTVEGTHLPVVQTYTQSDDN